MGGKRRYDHEEILRLYAQGHSMRHIAEVVGCHYSSVSLIVREAGVARPWPDLTWRASAVARVDEGELIKDVAADIGKGINTLSRACHAAGVYIHLPGDEQTREEVLDSFGRD